MAPTSAPWCPHAALSALLSFLKSALTLQLSRKPPLTSVQGNILCWSQTLNLWVGATEAEFGLTLRKNFLAIRALQVPDVSCWGRGSGHPVHAGV